METFKKFINYGRFSELIFLIVGLVFLLCFALINMPSWTWLFFLSIGILQSSLFSFVTRDEGFFQNPMGRKGLGSSISFLIDKNLFALIFTSIILSLVVIVINILRKLGLVSEINLFYKDIYRYLLLILASDNLILLINYKNQPAYESGLRRDLYKDLSTGFKSLLSILPSILVNIFFILICFYFSIKIKFTYVLIYYLFSVFVYPFSKKDKKWQP